MAKTLVDTLVQKVLRRGDYVVSGGDTDLNTLIIDAINDSLKRIKQLCYDYELYQDISKQVTFKTIYNQAWIDITNAFIVGNSTTFTGIAGDKLTVTIDGVSSTTADLVTATTVALVASAINTACSATVATVNGLGYLQITSPTSGTTSSVIIANSSGTPCARLFATSADQSQSAITDLDEILVISERTYKFALMNMEYSDFAAMYPDPDSIRAVVPDIYARWYNRIYFGPTPNANSLLYMDYLFDVTEVVSGNTLPFDNEYDPLIIAMAKVELMEWLDSTNATGIALAKAKVTELRDDLIVKAAKNVKMNRQTSSRRNMIPYFSPRKKIVA